MWTYETSPSTSLRGRQVDLDVLDYQKEEVSVPGGGPLGNHAESPGVGLCLETRVGGLEDLEWEADGRRQGQRTYWMGFVSGLSCW